MGIDITFANLRSSASSAVVGANTQLCNHQRHLQTTEKQKIMRAKRISKDSNETFDGEEVNADLLDQNQILIPGAIDQFGAFGPCLQRFFFGTAPMLPLPPFQTTKRMSQAMLNRAYSEAVPEGILLMANKRWANQNHTNPSPMHQWYGENYIESTPSTWATQQLGLAVVRCMANHIKYAKWTACTANIGTQLEQVNSRGYAPLLWLACDSAQPEPSEWSTRPRH